MKAKSLHQIDSGLGGSGSGRRAFDRAVSAQLGARGVSQGRGGIRTARGRRAALAQGERALGRARTRRGRR